MQPVFMHPSQTTSMQAIKAQHQLLAKSGGTRKINIIKHQQMGAQQRTTTGMP